MPQIFARLSAFFFLSFAFAVLAAPPVYTGEDDAGDAGMPQQGVDESSSQAAPGYTDTGADSSDQLPLDEEPPLPKAPIIKGMLKECPPDMEYVIVDYNPKHIYEVCIDRYEYPNQKGRFPLVNVSWYKAKSTCAALGKYLCWDSEWKEACTGLNNWDYSYYNVYDEAKCNVSLKTYRKSGDNPGCKTHNYEVFDLIGNVREWTGGGGIGAFGGSFNDGKSARCSKWDGLSIKKRYKDVGFRCCAKVNTGRYGKVKKEVFQQKQGGAPDTSVSPAPNGQQSAPDSAAAPIPAPIPQQ
ncbi:MAG: hypothetical protein A2268_16740 [Candidatus Raymondbacteria bacterium RifOxyA12_full_50_37]|nr:MAG: hypothetical protein A2268_16740 [Candidatus Raymondbacteria bacterium RifOxyA12_full_50_37]OGJ86258.1 MAG: hypothetical protein A2248_16335 [Candidatus Raymondbacteria bacterium RIFOXYA2_FULL_49_16]OGJ95795.1 MAG: hypothetical protein A2453_11650 [Candidatus Raymondbacteria bacterium RIFOXYC2_FULL_50_21]OGJ96457.1 MAG: hypothetical protein A2350_04990 [Candidatus Raymondbacteria bacterium RifOxyB12_full_50_8]OGK04909.1 MAG: hypothetical protein A2487_21135 [Candidatus Raymondbacteria b